jgi:hypothetical protein
MSLMDFVVSPPGCGRSVTDFCGWGAPMRRSYVVPMKWMVIYECKVPEGALNLNSTKLPRPWSPWVSSPSRKNPHGRTGNRTRDLMLSSQKLWSLEHEAGLLKHEVDQCIFLPRRWRRKVRVEPKDASTNLCWLTSHTTAVSIVTVLRTPHYPLFSVHLDGSCWNDLTATGRNVRPVVTRQIFINAYVAGDGRL